MPSNVWTLLRQVLCTLATPTCGTCGSIALAAALVCGSRTGMAAEPPSPVDLALSPDEAFVVTANQYTDTLSLIRLADGVVVEHVPCGRRPTALAFTPDGRRLLATARYDGELVSYGLREERLVELGRLPLGFDPHDLAFAPDGRTAYVGLASGSAIAVVDVESLTETARIEVGRWPRHLAVSPDGTRLAVALAGEQLVAVIDTATRELLFRERFDGINPGQMLISSDNAHVYFPWAVYRHNPITPGNIRLGWVLASRIGRLRLDGPARREAMSLDVPGKAVSDPYGMAITANGEWMLSTGSGTHELLAYKLPTMVFQSVGGPGDLIDHQLAVDQKRFWRLELGGRPMAVRTTRDSRYAIVANYLSSSVQVVDLESREIARTVALSEQSEPSLARRGEAIFLDGRRSLDQWYSCHSCHYEGGTNAVTMDTRNDGSDRTFKTVLSLYQTSQTGPWTWHGWQKDMRAAMHKSLTDTMLGPQPTDDDVTAVLAYLDTLDAPPNPHLSRDGSLRPAIERGKLLFHSERAGCSRCHSGERLTDGEIHDVGLGSKSDAYSGYNTPSLIGVHDRAILLHHGRGKSLKQVLTEFHAPESVTGKGALSPEELDDLIEYLKTL